jgi:spore maturation protein CgeB
MNLKNKLKKNKLIYNLNAKIKEFSLIYKWKKLETKHLDRLKNGNEIYSENNIFEEVRIKISKKINNNGKHHVLWVGTDENQDRSGFNQALEKLFNVSYYYNSKGNYGLNTINKKGKKISFCSEVANDNGNNLVKLFNEINKVNKIDFVFGQMMSNYISKEYLKFIYDLNIPIFNISMDDKLPINWSIRENRQLGAIGLADYVDLTLTTSPEVCDWYMSYNKKAVFMPLGSSSDLYAGNKKKERLIDVLFIGNNYGIRGELISYLEKNGISVSAWGNGFKNGYADFNQSVELMKNSKIILGFSTLGYCRNKFTLKLRDFDATMSGALYLTQKNELLASLFCENEEIVFYDNLEDCVKKIKYYIANDSKREDIALKGNKKSMANFNWEIILKNIFNKVGIEV